MRNIDWEKPIIGKVTATDIAEATIGVLSATIAMTVLSLLFG